MNKLRYFITLLIMGFAPLFALASGKVLIVTTPTMPSQADPATTVDVFSMSLIRQIHRGLFTLDAGGTPIPDLAKDFQVTQNGNQLTITLKEYKFHDGVRLQSQHIKASLERAIKLRTNGFEKFNTVVGFNNFIAGKAGSISGIRAQSESSLIFALTRPSPRLAYALADLRYAIVRDPKKPTIGLGPYQLKAALGDSSVSLTKFQTDAGFDEISYRQVKEKDLDSLFESSQFVVSFLHPLSKAHASALRKKANVNELMSWKNYLLTVNPDVIPKEDTRAKILGAIDRTSIISACFPSEKLDNNLLPIGFPGYRANLERPLQKAVGGSPGRPLKLLVLEGVGEEKCLGELLAKQLSKTGINSDIPIVPTEKGAQEWLNLKADLMFFYLESEMNLDILQFFAEDSQFRLGLRKDEELRTSLRKMAQSTTTNELVDFAFRAQMRAINQQTALPFFIPKTYFIYSKNILPLHTGMIPPTYLDFARLTPGDLQ